MKILALDIATKTGWATDSASGTWDLKPNRGESADMRNLRLKAKVAEIIKIENIELVVYERSAGRHMAAVQVASQMIGTLTTYLLENKISYGSYSAKEIKKFFTGNGNASKLMMIDEAMRRFPEIKILDDNHADALAILELAKKEFNH